MRLMDLWMMAHPTKATVLVVCLMFSNQLPAQYPNIRVSRPASTRPEEVTIAINPINPLNLAAGANIDFHYYSTDGGFTWTEGRLTSTLGVRGDPCVAFDAEGNLFYAHLSHPASGYWLDRIVVQKSTDGGVTWNDGIGIGLNPPKQQDKEWIVADMTTSPFRNNLYMAWTEFDEYGSSSPTDSSRIQFSRSADRAESWSQPIKISDISGDCIDSDGTVEGAVPAVGPNGEIYISWAGPLGVLFDKSIDGGVTFGRDMVIASQPGGWDFNIPGIYRCNGLPVTACDVSNSPYRGNLYVMWSDQRNGVDNTDVFLIRSTDGGKTWGEIKKVNNDQSTRHQFFPWITVDPFTGIIYIAFYDRRNTSGNATEVYVARSVDGGESFENFKASESSFTPSQNIFFGDYINIAARNGKVYPIWMRMDDTNLSIWTAIISDTTTAIDEKERISIHDFRLAQNYPNPVRTSSHNPATFIEYTLPKTDHVALKVYDVLGHEVRTLVNGRQAAGRYRLQFDSRGLPHGLYFYRLRAGTRIETKKMVVIR